MNIEYTFRSQCYPIDQLYECEVDPSCDLSRFPAYTKLLEILAADGSLQNVYKC